MYEGLMRIPLVISWPAKYAEGQVSGALTELIDVVPTLYEAAGLDIPFWVQGLSLQPILTGESTEHRNFVRSEAFGVIAYPDQTHATMYRDSRWKLVSYHGKGIKELYDLMNDPWEHRNLADDQEYAHVLHKLMNSAWDASVFSHHPDRPRTAPY